MGKGTILVVGSNATQLEAKGGGTITIGQFLNETAVPVMALVREATVLFEVLMEEKSLRIMLEGDEHAQVEGDELFLRQALVNILHNAVKYSAVGETISVRVQNAASGQITVEIEDKGPGIPLEDQPKVFDRFYRVDKARWRESGGAGLGLSIAKWAVEAHGGTITLNSGSNGGCTFRIILPSFGHAAQEQVGLRVPVL